MVAIEEYLARKQTRAVRAIARKTAQRDAAEAVVISVTTGELDDIPEIAKRLRELT